VLANHDNGAVTMFLIAPNRVFVRDSACRLPFGLRLGTPGDAINDDDDCIL
jgi:hypothetical protein